MESSLALRVSEVEANDLLPLVEGYSEESEEVSEYFERFEELLETLSELNEIQTDCYQANWEGDDELPITEATVEKAKKLLFLVAVLPSFIRLPSVTPTASGYIELEWYKEKGHRFVIRLHGRGVFIYSGLFGMELDGAGQEVEKDTHGKSTFLTDVLPDEIKANLSQLYNFKIN